MEIGFAAALLGTTDETEPEELNRSMDVKSEDALVLLSVEGVGDGLRISALDCFHSVELTGRRTVGSMNTEPVL